MGGWQEGSGWTGLGGAKGKEDFARSPALVAAQRVVVVTCRRRQHEAALSVRGETDRSQAGCKGETVTGSAQRQPDCRGAGQGVGLLLLLLPLC